jgi:hypothetical protein
MRHLYAGFRRWDHAFSFCDDRIKTARAAGKSENWIVLNRNQQVLYAPAQNINLFCWEPDEAMRRAILLLLGGKVLEDTEEDAGKSE